MVYAAILLAILASSPSMIEAWELGKFYAPVETITSPRVDLASHPIGAKYRTHIRRTVDAQGVNFAGHFTVVTWGCGTSCTRFAIVNLVTDEIWHNRRLIATRGVSFRPHTRLLVLNPYDSEDRFPDIPIDYFEWTGRDLRKVRAPKTAG